MVCMWSDPVKLRFRFDPHWELLRRWELLTPGGVGGWEVMGLEKVTWAEPMTKSWWLMRRHMCVLLPHHGRAHSPGATPRP